MTTVLKLGGSVITEKGRERTLDGGALDRSADAVATAIESETVSDLVVVHGGGSFGHRAASDHGVSATKGSRDVAAATEIHGAMTALNGFVRRRLLDRAVPAVPVHPFSTAYREETGETELFTDQVGTLLGEGFVPVLHGDVIAQAGAGVTIVSGDELVAELTRQLGAERVGLCSTVPGVLDEGDDVIERIESFDAVASVLGESDTTDVTGGMAAKVRALCELDATASIFGLDELGGFLSGERTGTTIE